MSIPAGVSLWVRRLIMLIFFVLVLYNEYRSLHLMPQDAVIWQRLIIVVQLVIEFFVYSQTIIIIIGVYDTLTDSSAEFGLDYDLVDHPFVDVFVPIRRVDVDILEQTLVGIRGMDYPQDRLVVYLADDTPEKELAETYEYLADKYNAIYIYHPENRSFKAGMLNLSLPYASSEFITFFDFDQIPQPYIISHMIDLLQKYPDKAFVQAKKTFRGLDNLSKVWSALLYLQFFEVFEKTKNKSRSVMFAGSTACFRRELIDKVGGIPETTFTEDNNLTLSLLFEGHEGLFTNTVGSIGLVPPNFDKQISQLWRWSHGGTHTLSLNFRKLITNKNLNNTQRIEFISTLGITPILVMVYLYTLSFIPLFISGMDSPRPSILGISGIVLVPIAVSSTYVIFASLAIWFDRDNKNSEFSFSHLPGFIIIAVASNFLIFTSGLVGLFGKFGPQSGRGKWTRDIPILKMGVLSFILSILLMYAGYYWLMAGMSAAIMLIMIGFTLFPTIFVVIYYRQ